MPSQLNHLVLLAGKQLVKEPVQNVAAIRLAWVLPSQNQDRQLLQLFFALLLLFMGYLNVGNVQPTQALIFMGDFELHSWQFGREATL